MHGIVTAGHLKEGVTKTVNFLCMVKHHEGWRVTSPTAQVSLLEVFVAVVVFNACTVLILWITLIGDLCRCFR